MPQKHEFCEPVRVFAPHKKAEGFILVNLKINRRDMINWLEERDSEFVRLDVRVTDHARIFSWPQWSDDTRPYTTVNNWAPSGEKNTISQRNPDDAF